MKATIKVFTKEDLDVHSSSEESREFWQKFEERYR